MKTAFLQRDKRSPEKKRLSFQLDEDSVSSPSPTKSRLSNARWSSLDSSSSRSRSPRISQLVEDDLAEDSTSSSIASTFSDSFASITRLAESSLDSARKSASRASYHTKKQITGYKRHEIKEVVEYVDDGKGGRRKLTRLVRTGRVRSTSVARACCIIPIFLSAACALLWSINTALSKPWNYRLMTTPPANESVFYTAPHERPAFLNCAYCEECAPCRECYDGTSEQYEAKYDRCPASRGECGYPFGKLNFCPEKCAAWLALGPERLACIEPMHTQLPMHTYFTNHPDLTSYRDPNVPLLTGLDDPFGKAAKPARLPPSVYLPKGYDPAKQWPLIVFLCGRDCNTLLCMNQFGMRNLAHRYGFIYLSPSATSKPPFNDDVAESRFCTPADVVHDLSCAGSDDARYVWSAVEAVKARYSVKSVSLVGWSNGAAMANTLACLFSKHIHAAVMFNNGDGHDLPVANHSTLSPYGCKPEYPVHMLYAHDPNDIIVSYSHAMVNFETWSFLNGCSLDACPRKRRSFDVLPRLKGVISWGGDLLAAMHLHVQRHELETDEWEFADCGAAGLTRLWVAQTYGSDTSWLYTANPTPPGQWLPSVSLGHFPVWGQTNDAGENHALGQRTYEYLLELPYVPEKQPLRARSAAAAAAAPEPGGAIGRRLQLFAVANLSGVVITTHCEVWTKYKSFASLTVYLIVSVILGALASAALVACCITCRYRAQRAAVRRHSKYMRRKRNQALGAVRLSKLRRRGAVTEDDAATMATAVAAVAAATAAAAAAGEQEEEQTIVALEEAVGSRESLQVVMTATKEMDGWSMTLTAAETGTATAANSAPAVSAAAAAAAEASVAALAAMAAAAAAAALAAAASAASIAASVAFSRSERVQPRRPVVRALTIAASGSRAHAVAHLHGEAALRAPKGPPPSAAYIGRRRTVSMH